MTAATFGKQQTRSE